MISDKFRPLYHGTDAILDGNVLRPSSTRDVSGKEGNYVFASDSLQMAACYALRRPILEVSEYISIATIEPPSNWTFLVIDALPQGKPLPEGDGRVYATHRHQFNASAHFYTTREWTSPQQVPLVSEEPVLKVKNIEDLMHLGVQVFTLRKGCDAYHFGLFYESKMSERDIIGCSLLRWENKQRGINPIGPEDLLSP